MTDKQAEAFTFDGGRVEPGKTEELRYSVSETYLGDPVHTQVTLSTVQNPVQPRFSRPLSTAMNSTESKSCGKAPKNGFTDVCLTRSRSVENRVSN